jgi:4-azaleucine resistance transporter AzlC
MLCVSGLNQLYWIVGGAIGVVSGMLIPFELIGVDFVMTILFVVLAMDQWKAFTTHEPAFIGLASSVVCLIFLGPDDFMIPALITITAMLLIRRGPITKKLAGGTVS